MIIRCYFIQRHIPDNHHSNPPSTADGPAVEKGNRVPVALAATDGVANAVVVKAPVPGALVGVAQEVVTARVTGTIGTEQEHVAATDAQPKPEPVKDLVPAQPLPPTGYQLS